MHNNVDRSIPLYRKLADYLESAIRSGAFLPGNRLPSVRQCAQDQAVSISTVLAAYRCLEDAQLIETRPNAGHFVARISACVPDSELRLSSASPATVDIAAFAEMVIDSEAIPGMISFGTGYPAPAQLPVKRVERAMHRALQHASAELGKYPLPPGAEALRKAIAQRSLALGCALDPADILLTSGATESISLCLRALLRPGDTVAIESPTSFGLLGILEALRLRALEIPTHASNGISVDALALALRDGRIGAVLATPTLSNPIGACMPLRERERLVELLTRHRVPLIEDVIYNDLVGDEPNKRAVKSFDREGWVLLCSSYSKTVAPGLRIGWLHAGQFTSQVRKFKAATSGGNCALNEFALAEVLTESRYTRQLRRLHRINRHLLNDARETIAGSFPINTRVTDPVGGSMLWVALPETVDSLALFRACLGERILIAPGTLFSASGAYRNCIRLCIPATWGAEHRRALRRVGELVIGMLERAGSEAWRSPWTTGGGAGRG